MTDESARDARRISDWSRRARESIALSDEANRLNLIAKNSARLKDLAAEDAAKLSSGR